MIFPIALFRVGLGLAVWAPATIFFMRCWIELTTNFNEFNRGGLANQLFNTDKIKPIFSLIDKSNLVANAIGGFTLFILLAYLTITDILYFSLGIMLVASGLLFYASGIYRHDLPDIQQNNNYASSNAGFSADRLRKLIRRYVVLLIVFVVVAQMLFYLVEYQYFHQLTVQNISVDDMARFLGIFTGILGLTELFTQPFTSSRLVERLGLFFKLGILPTVIAFFSCLCLLVSLPILVGAVGLFIGLVILKFIDEWLHYTFLDNSYLALLETIPAQQRARAQSLVQIAKFMAMGLLGIGILLLLILSNRIGLPGDRIFLFITLGLSLLWLGSILVWRSQYWKLQDTEAL